MQASRGSLCDKISYGPVTGIHIYNYYSVQLYPWDSNINLSLLGSTDLDMHFRYYQSQLTMQASVNNAHFCHHENIEIYVFNFRWIEIYVFNFWWISVNGL